MQNNYFLKNSVIDILEKPNRSSSLSSQLIYGEKFKILDQKNGYFKIKSAYDKYTGFIKKIYKHKKFRPTHKIGILKSRIYLGKPKNKSNKQSNAYGK